MMWLCLIGIGIAGLAVGFVLAGLLFAKILDLPPW
jgi:tetrahydromethanopterin S-methyltransferase subunit F